MSLRPAEYVSALLTFATLITLTVTPRHPLQGVGQDPSPDALHSLQEGSVVLILQSSVPLVLHSCVVIEGKYDPAFVSVDRPCA